MQQNNQLTELLSSSDPEFETQPEAATMREDRIEMGMYKGSKIVIKQVCFSPHNKHNKTKMLCT